MQLNQLLVAVLTYLLKSATEECNFKKHVEGGDRNHVNRISRLKAGKFMQWQGYQCQGRKEIGSKLREDSSNPIETLDYLVAIVCLCDGN